MTYTPFSSIFSAMACASLASPSMMGTMAWEPSEMLNPLAFMPSRKYLVLASSLSRRAVLEDSISKTLMLAPTTGGASELLKRYGRAFWRRMSITSLRPVVYPPVAPPRALPSVELITSTDPGASPQCSSVPRPVFPTNPVAWHSSTNSSAPYLSASALISFRGAMCPSMLKTPSVAMSFRRAPSASFSLASRSPMSMWLYLSRWALQRRMPSMMEAWFSWSLITASSEVRMASNSPALASKHEGYRMVSSVPWKAVMASSRRLCRSCVPQMNRTELRPKPWESRVRWAASTSSGWLLSPR
mmetsp:Transcript_8670/g.24473  ORF Transcript_8670/g.24473 Transcript_8670/m.24473 type:complete len:301 (-) Transcript_8670:201-1103(-)